MRVQVSDVKLVDDLADYLGRCGCVVRKYGARVLGVSVSTEVSLDAALALVREGRCYSCGSAIAPALASLGSTQCHDCRDDGRGDAEAAEAWCEMEVEAFLGVWRAWHPQASVAVLAPSIAAPRRSAA
jgi:hypothetical protein